MKLKIVVPTHIWEFEPIQRQWFDIWCNKGYNIEIIHEQGEAPSGRNVRQKFTEIFAGQDFYLHWLDIDNLVPYDVIDWLLYKPYDEPKIYMFDQIWHTNGIKRLNAKAENCLPARCDIAQLFVHGSFLKDMVWSADYENDGQFIAELHRRHPNDFVFVNHLNVWYNALRPHSQLYNGQIITIA